MYKRLIFTFLFSFLLLSLQAQTVYVIKLKDEIDPASARYVRKGIQAAHAAKADLILIHMDTYGGLVVSADSIRQNLLNSDIPTAVYIDKNAASAGALISIATDSIFMAPGASIGAATVVSGADGQAMPDKYQSYFRGIMRATAERTGRDPKIAEKMVDQNLDLPEISPAGQVITFTPAEAMKYDYCDGVFDSMDEVLDYLGLGGADLIHYEKDWTDHTLSFLVHPIVSSIIMMMIFGGIFLELKTPGIGVPSIIAVLGMALFFAPHYIDGLAESWEIVIFAAGIILIALEIFVIPGFGVAGIAGIILTAFGAGSALLRNDFMDFSFVSGEMIARAFAITLISMVTAVMGAIWIAKKFLTGKIAHPLVDETVMDKESGYTSLDKKFMAYVGKTGVTLTDLKPSGVAEVDGNRIEVETEGEYIARGSEILVNRIRNTNIIVKKKA